MFNSVMAPALRNRLLDKLLAIPLFSALELVLRPAFGIMILVMVVFALLLRGVLLCHGVTRLGT